MSSSDPDNFSAVIRLYERKKDGTYLFATIGSISRGRTEISSNPQYALSPEYRYTAEDYVRKAMNPEGKLFINIYPLAQ